MPTLLANDPVAVEAAKTFWSDIDNHQLRPDPPICDFYKVSFCASSNQDDTKTGTSGVAL